MSKETTCQTNMQNKNFSPIFLLFTLATTSCTDGNGHLTDFGVGAVCGVVGMVLFFIWVSITWYKSKKEKEQAVEEALKERKDFTESKVIKGKGGNYYYLATDEERKKVFYVYGDKKLLFDFKDVVAVDVIQDGDTLVSKKSIAGAIGGALIGGAVLGNDTGSLIGAAAFGTSSGQSQISRLYVHILLRNQPLSSLDFMCYDNLYGEAKPSLNYRFEYEEATARAKELYDLFRLIIDTADRDEQKQIAQTQQKNAIQELKDLAELHKQGLIDAKEFAKMKRKIIGAD